MDISLKNIILAGIGSMAYSYEKGSDMIESLIKRGELTVRQGIELNEELKRSSGVKESAGENIMNMKRKEEDLLTREKLREILSSLNLAAKDDIKKLEERIEKLEEKL